MKKLLALILTVIMLLSTVAIVASAESAQPVEINLESLYGATYVGKALGANDAKPVQDGVISDGEYQSKYVVDKSGERDTARGSVPTALLEDYTEYVSHDAEWIYVGFDFYNQADNLRGRLYWNLSFITSLDFTYNGGNSANVAFTQNGTGIYEGWNYGAEIAAYAPAAGAPFVFSQRNNTVPTGATVPVINPAEGTGDVYIATGRTDNAALNGNYSAPDDGVPTSRQVYEFKVSKDWYAAQVGLESADDVRELAWATILQYVDYYGTAYTQIGHFLTDDERADLAALNGVEYTGTNYGTNYQSYPVDNGMLPRAIILDEDPHIWDDGVVTREPTHLLAGVKTYTCSHCEQTKIESVEFTGHTYGEWQTYNDTSHVHYCECGKWDYADHSWNNGVVTTEPTHLAPGVKTYTCTDCGATKTANIDNLTDHTYGAWQQYSSSQHRHYCECGKWDYADHSWNNGVVTTEPTHLAPGVKTYTCTDCGATKTANIDNLTDHTYGAWQNYNSAQHVHSCACGQREYANHSWNNGVVTLEPTHLATGVKTYTCTDCGATKTANIDKLTDHTYGAWQNYNSAQHVHSCACGQREYANHSWNNGAVTLEPTHFTTGTKTYTCTDCGATKTETLPKLTEHEYGSWGKHNATQHIRFCQCGGIDYADHTWSDGIITIPATQTTTGVKTYTCLDCGETSLKVIDKLGASDGTTEDETDTDTDVDAEVTTTSSTTSAAETSVATTNAATAAEATMIVPVADYGCEGTILGGGAAMISIVSMLGVAVTRKRKKED